MFNVMGGGEGIYINTSISLQNLVFCVLNTNLEDQVKSCTMRVGLSYHNYYITDNHL